MRKLIITDGFAVEYIYGPTFNSSGNVIMSWTNNEVTHWMPLPKTPKE